MSIYIPHEGAAQAGTQNTSGPVQLGTANCRRNLSYGFLGYNECRPQIQLQWRLYSQRLLHELVAYWRDERGFVLLHPTVDINDLQRHGGGKAGVGGWV